MKAGYKIRLMHRTVYPLLLLLSTMVWAQSQTTAPQADAVPQDSVEVIPIETHKAVYPKVAIEKGIQGQVVIGLVISEAGEVENAEVVSGNPILADSALDAAKKFKFKPFIKDGRPVKVKTTLPFDFYFREKVMEKGVSKDRTTTSEQQITAGPPSAASSVPKPVQTPPTTSMPVNVPVGKGVSVGRLVHQVAPVYPPEARRAGVQGTVLIHAIIGKDGRLHNAKAIGGPPELFDAALGAVQQWRYTPYTLNGNPVEVSTTVQVNFKLGR